MSVSKTQIRLQQLTGSAVELNPGGIQQGVAPGAADHQDLADILKYYSQAISNVHGKVDFGSQNPGLIKHERSVQMAATGSDQPGYAGGRELKLTMDRFRSGGSGEEVKVVLAQGSGNDQETITLDNPDGAGDGSSSHAAAIQFKATNGGVGFDFGDARKLYADGGKIHLQSNQDDAEAILIENKGSNSSAEMVLRNEGGTGADAILIDSMAGGIKATAAVAPVSHAVPSMELEAATPSGVIGLKAGGTGGDHFRLAVSASQVGVHGEATLVAHKQGGTAIRIDKMDTDLFLGDSDDKSLKLASRETTSGPISHVSGSTMMQITASNGLKIASPGPEGGIFLSGSGGLAFAADAGFGFGPGTEGGLVMVSDAVSESATYRSNFSATTSVVAAINELKTLIGNTQPTLFRMVKGAGSVSANNFVGTLSKVQGDFTPTEGTWLGREMNELDVYVNGQLLMSGSRGDVGSENVDYNLAWNSGAGFYFAFEIREDDVIQAIDRS